MFLLLFTLLTLCTLSIAYNQQKITLYLFILTLMLSLFWFWHHLSSTLTIHL